MIRFRCVQCDKSLKAAEKNAGATVICPRCQWPSVVPGGQPPLGERARTEARHDGDQAPGLLAGMSPALRWVVAGVAGVAASSLLLAFLTSLVPGLAGVASATSGAAMILVPSSAVVLLAILYGHLTGCPSCGRWWARNHVETEFVDREVFDKEGVPFARARYRTDYRCSRCGHRWSVISTDEYKNFGQRRPQGRLG